MIISHLIGGLGNQMFQYAAARAMSLRWGHTLRLDISGFDNYALHQGFELGRVFSCPIDIATDADLRAVLGWQSSAPVRQLLSRRWLRVLRHGRYVIEPGFGYWPGLMRIVGKCYLRGYWQSERYFADAAETIRRDFIFREPLDDRNARLAAEICSVNSISLHVRRGDYVQNPETFATHGLCSLEYYRAAIRHVTARVKDPQFYIFSDDQTWVSENLKMGFPVVNVCDNTGIHSYRDMQLMSYCRHHIIANSSFSWWGAWLNPNPNKIVIAPKKWFATRKDTNDLVPGDWVTIA